MFPHLTNLQYIWMKIQVLIIIWIDETGALSNFIYQYLELYNLGGHETTKIWMEIIRKYIQSIILL